MGDTAAATHRLGCTEPPERTLTLHWLDSGAPSKHKGLDLDRDLPPVLVREPVGRGVGIGLLRLHASSFST